MATSTNTAVFTQTETFSIVWTFPSQTATAHSTSVYSTPYSGTQGLFTVRATVTNILATPSTAAYSAVRSIVDDSPDLILTSSTSSPPTSTSTTPPSTTTSPTITPTATQSSSSKLSQSAKLGIGLGVGLGVPALFAVLAALWWFLLRRPNKQKHMSSQPEQKPPNMNGNGYGYGSGIPCRVE